MKDPLTFFHSDAEPSTSFVAGADGPEMLRIAPDGFYVRGVKLKQDADEARAVYEAFSAWMSAVGIMRRH